MKYRNKGGPWRRSGDSGEVLAHGAEFEPTPKELERMQIRQQLGTRFEVVIEAPTPPSSVAESRGSEMAEALDMGEGDEGGTTPVVPLALEDWPLRMTPTLYLKIHPDGQHAELARRHVAAVEVTDGNH